MEDPQVENQLTLQDLPRPSKTFDLGVEVATPHHGSTSRAKDDDPGSRPTG